MTNTAAAKRIVVTGINGFVGKHLALELHNSGHTVIGLGRESAPSSELDNFIDDYLCVDLTKGWPESLVADAVIHLAGLAAVGPSFEEPQMYIDVNSTMITHMAEHYLKQSKKPRLVVISSGAIYSPNQPMPLTESAAVGFSSPYAVSKVLVENQCAYYQNRGLDCVVVRPFNHIGPGQLEGFLVPDVINQIREGNGIQVGNITTRRDYTDVRDVARAYRMLATAEELNHSIYNVCSGASKSGEEIVKILKKLSGNPDVVVSVDKAKVRPTDAPEIYGSPTLLTQDTGWIPTIPLEQTLADCLES